MNVSELIERLRWYGRDSGSVEQSVLLNAADALEAQARKIEEQAMAYLALFGEVQEALDRLAAAERDAERYRWLVLHGESVFGTLWRDATAADIDAAREGE